jgi:transposase InsO family protein
VKTVCEVLGVARSNVAVRASRSADWSDGRKGRRPIDDAALVAEIRAEVTDLPTYGYRRACEFVRGRRRAEGRPPVNHKRVYRVMREHALLLPRSPRRGANRRHDGRVAVDSSDTRWCSDALEIRADNGERVRLAFSLDCCDREVMSWVAVANAGIDGDLVRDMMLEAVEYRFGMLEAPAPIQWLSDNGSPYIAGDTREFARELGLVPLTTPIESPQSNGMAEAFVNTFKRDYVSVNPTPDARTILASLPRWIEHYNELHPHSALKMRSPRMFRHEQSLVE